MRPLLVDTLFHRFALHEKPAHEAILIAVVDGLKGFPEAIEAVFPKTLVQTCIVHLIRYSLGAPDPVLRLPAGDPSDHLHD